MLALLCGAICTATLLTVGRTAAAEAQMLARLDQAGSRLLVVTDADNQGLISTELVAAIGRFDTVERAIGVDVPTDVVNAGIGAGGHPAPAWAVTGPVSDAVTLTVGRWPRPGEALVAADAQARLGLVHPVGVVEDANGRRIPIVGAYVARAPFERFDAGVVVAADASSRPRAVHVVVTDVGAAGITVSTVATTIAPPRMQDLAITSPTALADLQQLIGGDLGDYGRAMLLLTLGGGAALVAVIVLAEVMLRRKDLGRRRALGISRWGLVTLVVMRTLIAVVPGAVVGVLVGSLYAHQRASLPPPDFMAGIALLTVLAAGLATVPPALLAATRDPVTVLRTP
jgi:putative ABC transport system permease protein